MTDPASADPASDLVTDQMSLAYATIIHEMTGNMDLGTNGRIHITGLGDCPITLIK